MPPRCKLALSVVVNFWSEDRARRCGGGASDALSNGFQMLAISAGIASFLAFHTLKAMPCIVPEFNVWRSVTLAASAAFLWASLATFWLQRTDTRLRLDPAPARSAGLVLFAALSATALLYGKRRLKHIAKERDEEDRETGHDRDSVHGGGMFKEL